jgi:hypothetical protein
VPPPPLPPPSHTIPSSSTKTITTIGGRLSTSTTHSTIPFPPPPPLPQSFLNAHTQVSPAASFSLAASQTDNFPDNINDNKSESAILYAVQPQASLSNASIRHHSVISVSKHEQNGESMPGGAPPPPLYEDENENSSQYHHKRMNSNNNIGENDNFLDVVYVDGSDHEIHKQINVLY